MKRIISLLCTGLAVCSLCFSQDADSQVQPPPEGKIFRQEGIASWYGAEFDGRPTASGEIFNSALFTAAHPTLPFGTVLIITNTHNDKKVTVTVNDRGPFVSARIIDVSKAAAEQLDMLVTGTAPVLVESAAGVVMPAGTGDPRTEPAPVRPWTETPAFSEPQTPALTAASAPSQMPPAVRPVPAAPERLPPAVLKPAIVPAANKTYRLQVGSYRIARNAVEAFDKLKTAGLNPAYERYGEFFRVVLAGVRAEDVLLITERIGAAGFREALIREE
ncbi:MAG: septal ring lytic transglycosylase RlpA family protein [Treponema sp.]|jgi:rare lipoprotein A|nr:septal ring lytic transglycosylase RlpA family protein [Treponema sp.]